MMRSRSESTANVHHNYADSFNFLFTQTAISMHFSSYDGEVPESFKSEEPGPSGSDRPEDESSRQTLIGLGFEAKEVQLCDF